MAAAVRGLSSALAGLEDTGGLITGGQNAVLVSFAKRRRGLVFRGGGATPSCLSDLARMTIVPRQPESGTDALFRELAQKSEIDMSQLAFADVARTEDEAVEAVKRGAADAAFGLEAVARSYGLEYLHIVEEEFALLVDRRAWFEAPFQKVLAFCGSAQFADRAQAYGGYDVEGLGTVIWNA